MKRSRENVVVEDLQDRRNIGPGGFPLSSTIYYIEAGRRLLAAVD
jgi:hypothetical protein